MKNALGLAALSCACLAAIRCADAATVVQPDIRIGANYISVDNVSSAQQLSESGAAIDAQIRFARVDEVSTLAFTPKILRTYYSSNKQLEREEERATLTWDRLFQTGSANFRFDFSRKDLFSAEFEDAAASPGSDTSVGGSESGVVGSGTRDRFSTTVGLAKKLSQRTDFILNVDYVDIKYNEKTTVNRVDFNQMEAATGFRFRLTPRTSFSVTGGGRRYDGDNDLQVDSTRGNLRLDWQLSEQTSAYLGAGYEQLKGTQGNLDLGDESIVPIEGGISRRTERTTYTFEIGQYAQPTSIGDFRDRKRASVRLEHQLTEKVTLQLGIAGYRDKALRDTGIDESRTYYSGLVDLDWAFSRRWSLGVQYSHNQQDYSGIDAPTSGVKSRDELFLSIRYRGLDRTREAGGR